MTDRINEGLIALVAVFGLVGIFWGAVNIILWVFDTFLGGGLQMTDDLIKTQGGE